MKEKVFSSLTELLDMELQRVTYSDILRFLSSKVDADEFPSELYSMLVSGQAQPVRGKV